MSGLVVGRPGRRVFEPSYFWATSLRYQRRIVSGVAGRRSGGSSGTVHCAEDSVLLEQVVNNRLLVSIDPAGEHQEEEGERARQRVHGVSLPARRPLFNWSEIGICAVTLD